MDTAPTQQHLVILTGASRGLGLALAQQLLDPAHMLLCVARHTSDALAHTAQSQGVHLEQWVQDLTDTEEAAERLERWLHSLHAPSLASATLINNAGVMPTIGPLQDSPAPDLARSLRLNLEAPLLLSAAFLRSTQAWVAQGWDGPRKVLNISSGLGRRPVVGQAPYCAAKAGLDHFSRCTALDEARRPNGARIVSLAPGMVDTGMQLQLRACSPETFPDVQRYQDQHRQGLLFSPEHAAGLVLAYLQRPDFGQDPVADVRNPP